MPSFTVEGLGQRQVYGLSITVTDLITNYFQYVPSFIFFFCSFCASFYIQQPQALKACNLSMAPRSLSELFDRHVE